MSCSSPITTYTNAKFISNTVNRWKVQFACGHCANCNQRLRAEWRLRAYYEIMDKIKSGWKCLFDTLTYSDEYLVTYNDVTKKAFPFEFNKLAFSRNHIQLFFKRLRRTLEYAGYQVKDNLRYMVTSEFGTSDFTRGRKNTHRPHYHILILYNLPLNPIDLSKIISRSWSFGITDGVRPFDCSKCPVKNYCKGYCLYKSSQYVMSERVVNGSDMSSTLKAVNYVTKYISKDMFNYKKLANNAECAYRSLGTDIDNDYLAYKQFRQFMRNVLPFHLQSRGFGLSAFKYVDLDSVERTEKMRMPSQGHDVVKEIALPKYYRRKLWYDYKKVDGRIIWYLNDAGISHQLSHLQRKIDNFKSDYRSYDVKIAEDKLDDLAIYNCVYRNTICNNKYLYFGKDKYFKELLRYKDKGIIENHGTFKDKMLTGKYLCNSSYLDEDTGEIISVHVQKHKEFIPPFNMVIVNDLTCSFWNGFDKLLDKYYQKKKEESLIKDNLEASKEAQIDRYKSLGMLK